MSGGIVRKFTGTLVLLLILSSGAYSQDNHAGPVRFMFYNVENLFDVINDAATEDDEFLPGGLRRWNFTRYNRKIGSLSKAIVSAGEWDPPAMIGMCEVENRNVVEDLVYGTSLARYNYSILHKDSPDPRGIDVCLIYRSDLVRIIGHDYLIPLPASSDFRSRSVLYVKCEISGDTLHLFINHWPSRRGGVLAGEAQRQKIASMIRQKADSLAVSGGNVRIIFAGDFNATPDDGIIHSLTGEYTSGLKMMNLSADLPGGAGTYRYMGIWEMIDQVIVSEGLTEGSSGLCAVAGSFRIYDPEFLLTDDPSYPGKCPWSTYRGYRYQGGFSDHLPVILDLKVR